MQKQPRAEIQWWLTSPDRSSLFEPQSPIAFSDDRKDWPIINLDTTRKFQEVDGFGFTLTGGSAQLINGLSKPRRDSLLRQLFLAEGNGIGISYLRISIGASDLDDHVFSCDDVPIGSTDLLLKKFNLTEHQKNLIPVLKEIIDINPTIKIMGSPWSAPSWMKTNGNPKGGKLKPEYYEVYANYLVKFIQGLDREGIALHAITVQNEPENPSNNPSMLMTAEEQTAFIGNHLGPAFRKALIKTKIILFDHNCDHPEYPITVLSDSATKQYVDGSAFHLYLGEIAAMSKVHDAHPDKNIYFTEQWTSADGDFGGDLKWHVENLIVGGMRNWSRTVLEWNLAADATFHPHTPDGGCDRCLGALTLGDTVSPNVSYYIIAHASKLVRPGSVRIASNEMEGLPNVAFINPTGEKVLIVLNANAQAQNFQISYGNQQATSMLPSGAVATYFWK